jgi:RimJ/RimL family protein N-acetyltransferase
MKLPTIRTARLVLRPFEPADAARVQQLAGAREIAMNTTLIPHPYPDGAAEEWIAAQEQKSEEGHINFAIDDGDLVGVAGLRVQREFERAEIGYWLGIPYWGRGYATEAVGAIIRYGFEELSLNRIYAGYFSRNRASGRVMEKNGMKQEGVLRQHVKKWDAFVDVVYYGILRSEWRQRGNEEFRIQNRE